MNGTVAILESRLGTQLADLISRHGGRPLLAPAIAEVPDADDASIARFISELEAHPAKAAIFQTGVGTRALFEATDRLGLASKFKALLGGMLVAARGPKPVAALRSRGIRIDVTAAEPFTTDEVLAALVPVPLAGGSSRIRRSWEPWYRHSSRGSQPDSIDRPAFPGLASAPPARLFKTAEGR